MPPFLLISAVGVFSLLFAFAVAQDGLPTPPISSTFGSRILEEWTTAQRPFTKPAMATKYINPLLSFPGNSFYVTMPMTDSLRNDYYPGQSVIDSIWMTGSWSMKESVVASIIFSNYCKQEDTKNIMIDGGAHIGYFTHLALSHGCDVLAIEPYPLSREFIKQSTVMNGVEEGRLTIINAVVSDNYRESIAFDGWQVIPEEQQQAISSSSENENISHDKKQMRPMSIRLDDTITELNKDASFSIPYIKLDVEGHEFEALNGLSKLLNSKTNQPLTVYIELTTFDKSWIGSPEEQAVKAAKLISILGNAGFKILPLEGRWSDKLEFLPMHNEDRVNGNIDINDVAKMIIASQAIGCQTQAGVCITEIIAVSSKALADFNGDRVIDNSVNFANIVEQALAKEKDLIRMKIQQEAINTGGAATNNNGGLTEDIVPWHTIYLKDSFSTDENKKTFGVYYPADVHLLQAHFKKANGPCDEMLLNENDCNSVIQQAKQFILTHAARQLGIVEIPDRVSF